MSTTLSPFFIPSNRLYRILVVVKYSPKTSILRYYFLGIPFPWIGVNIIQAVFILLVSCPISAVSKGEQFSLTKETKIFPASYISSGSYTESFPHFQPSINDLTSKLISRKPGFPTKTLSFYKILVQIIFFAITISFLKTDF